MVALGGLNISLGAGFQGTGSVFEAEQRMEEGAVTAGYRRPADNASLMTRSVMLDDVKSMLTDITFSAPPSAAPLTLTEHAATACAWRWPICWLELIRDTTANKRLMHGKELFEHPANSWERLSFFLQKIHQHTIHDCPHDRLSTPPVVRTTG